MKTTGLFLMTVAVLLSMAGCGGGQAKTGYLSDYSRLVKEEASLRYVNEQALAGYSGFIVDKVDVYLYEGEKAKGDLTQQELDDLTNYLHAKIVEAVRGAGKKMAYQPGPGVARLRVALTDLDASKAVSAVPQASLLGAGLGGAAMEAEIVDSVTNKQIAAIVQKQQGSRIPFSSLGKWTAAKQVMDNWAKKFKERLE